MTDGDKAPAAAGAAGVRGYVFELTGGALCLDLANTLEGRATGRIEDRLSDYASLLAWGLQSGAIRPREAAELERLARREPGGARKALASARKAREAIFEVFRAEAEGRRAGREALATLEAALPAAYFRVELAREGDAYTPRWRGQAEMDRVLWPALRSALELLASPDLRLVRVCASETCVWLFMDRSRNRSRRWCDMKICGNRHKAREHYRRTRDAG